MNKIRITTPENIEIEYRLAGLGARAAAAVIDILIQTLAIAVIIITLVAFKIDPAELYEDYQGWVIGAAILVIWVIVYGYFIIFEMAMNGMTPGKKIFGLRTIRNNGQPITIKHSIIRNLFRIIIDLYGVGVVLMFFSKQHKRVGDNIASTIVIVEEKNGIYGPLEIKASEKSNYKYSITRKEYTLLKNYLYRKDKLGQNIIQLEKKLGDYFTEKLEITKAEGEYNIFLNELFQQAVVND
ncbi:MAG: RDD family protein [Maledivibacter sp.]|jgi:uncharacterized RDD family membrane protein YckC|nr:RDD family protein [Maledivibacter sp.]